MAYDMPVSEAQEELERIESYRPIFEATNRPFPTPPVYETFDKSNYNYYEIMGASAIGFRFASWGSIIYSSIRTAGIFAQIVAIELSANNWNSTLVSMLVFISALAILLGVEGFLYAFGQERGKESGKLSVSWWGAGTALAMSGLAGLLPSLGILPDNEASSRVISFVLWLLAFVSGLGVLPLVYFGAENLGVLETKWKQELDDEKDRIERENQQAYDKYMQDVDDWNKDFQADYRRIGRSALFGEDTFVARRKSSSTKSPAQTDSRNYTEEIREYLKSNGFIPEDVGKDGRITPVQIADALRFEPGSSARKNVSTMIGRLKNEYDPNTW